MNRTLLTDDMRRRLVEARVAKGWAIGQVAWKAEIFTDFMESCERGEVKHINMTALACWCNALGLTLKLEIE